MSFKLQSEAGAKANGATPAGTEACLGTTTGLTRVKSEDEKAVLTLFLQIINKYN
jgi:hypothetical protein